MNIQRLKNMKEKTKIKLEFNHKKLTKEEYERLKKDVKPSTDARKV